jgi:hypothetical protein
MRHGFACDVPPWLLDADDLLTRYGRWAMDRYRKHHCGSAEGRYRIPPNDDDRQPREALLSTPDAMRAQRALSRVPELERVVLAVLYIPHRLPVEARLRKLRVPARLCQERHREGLTMFANLHRAHELDKRETVCNRIPTPLAYE